MCTPPPLRVTMAPVRSSVELHALLRLGLCDTERSLWGASPFALSNIFHPLINRASSLPSMQGGGFYISDSAAVILTSCNVSGNFAVSFNS